MNAFELGGILPSPSPESVKRREEIDAEIATALAKIQEPIDTNAAIEDIERSIVREVDDQKRHELGVQRAALLQYREQKSAPILVRSVESAESVPELSPEKQREHDELGLHQAHDERRPTTRFGRLRSVQRPASDHQEGTGVRPLNLEPLRITDEPDIGKAAM